MEQARLLGMYGESYSVLQTIGTSLSNVSIEGGIQSETHGLSGVLSL